MTYTILAYSIIGVFFIFYLWNTIYLWRIAKSFSNVKDVVRKFSVEKPCFLSLMATYKRSLTIDVNQSKKTNMPAMEIFSLSNVCRAANLNLRNLESGPNILIGLGLLGTFIGLFFGLKYIKIDNPEALIFGIQKLIDGAGAAFSSSLVGILLSLIITLSLKFSKNKLANNLNTLCYELDAAYYIDDVMLSNHNQRQFFEGLYANMKTDMDARNRQLIEQLESVKNTVASPATDMVEGIIDKLGNSLEKMMADFKTSLSGSAMKEMENLASTLGTATSAMAQLPQNMEEATNTLKMTITEVKTSINEITRNASKSNNEAVKTMQEQMLASTNTLNDTVTKVTSLMEEITETTQRNNQRMAEQIAEQTAKMNAFVNTTMANMQTAMREAITTSMNDMGDQQQKMLEAQEGTIEETKALIEAFNSGIDHMKEVSDGVSDTIETFKTMQSDIKGTVKTLEVVSGNISSAYESFSKMQTGYTKSFAQLQERSELSLEKVAALLRNSGEMGDEYVRKFDMIRLGLAAIFEQVQGGLLQYSKTVKESTQNYLNEYSRSLTDTTDALKSSIAQQSEVVEMLTDLLNKKK